MDDFDAYYERHCAHCICAGAEPLTPKAHRARLEEWNFLLGHWRDTDPEEAGNDDKNSEQVRIDAVVVVCSSLLLVGPFPVSKHFQLLAVGHWWDTQAQQFPCF